MNIRINNRHELMKLIPAFWTFRVPESRYSTRWILYQGVGSSDMHVVFLVCFFVSLNGIYLSKGGLL